jgi:rsbT co-antagonist protein RsbR
MERMLGEVARVRARHAILDLTGVEHVDARTAAYLVDLVRAIRLLGAEAIVTGIRPSVAQIFVEVGADLSAIPMRSNLRSGLEYCMRKLQARRGRADQ